MKLPTPTALAHSEKLTQHIREKIFRAGGNISFAQFMEMALYEPGLGYYSAGAHKLGKGGDFVTAPEISPLFAETLASQCQEILCEWDQPDILELGAGSGIFAGDLLLKLEQLHSLPRHYFILEISADLRARQQAFLKKYCPHFFGSIVWLDTLPTEFTGIIFANEVADAMPVHCFALENGNIKERCVAIQENQFSWEITQPTTPQLTEQVNIILQSNSLPNHYHSEINLRLPAWIKTLADTMKEGVLLLCDYGYGRREYYHPDRNTGTLMCFYQHHKHRDPFQFVGLQDITAHVDFTTVIESAYDAGLFLSGYTTQASFLFAAGILDILQSTHLSSADLFQQNQAIKTLTLPSQMGEIIKIMGLNKNFDKPLKGFSLQSRSRDL